MEQLSALSQVNKLSDENYLFLHTGEHLVTEHGKESTTTKAETKAKAH